MKFGPSVLILAALPAWLVAQDASEIPRPPRGLVPSASGLRLEDKVQLTLIENIDVPAREAGVLESISVREGALVEDGQQLAQIDDAEPQLAKQKAQIERQIAQVTSENDVKVRLFRKAADVAWKELERSQESNRQYKGTVSQTEMDRQRLAAEKAELEIEQAQHDRKIDQLTVQLKDNEYVTADRAVKRRQILAPLAGMVVEVYRRPGEWVQPGEAVMRVVRINRLRAEGFVAADRAGMDLMGQPAVFTVDLPGRPQAEFPGRIVFVSPEINPEGQVVRIVAEIDNPRVRLRSGAEGFLLRPGMQGFLTVTLPEDVTAKAQTGRVSGSR